jgi:DNA-binding HxlR family transcriptional regulator
MEPQTYSVLAVVGSSESLELLVALLHQSGTVEDLSVRTRIGRSTVSRRLEALASVGLVSRESPRGEFQVTCPEELRRALEAVSTLSDEITAQRQQSEASFQKRLRRTRLRAEVADDEVSS